MTPYIKIQNIQVAQCLHQFIEQDVLPHSLIPPTDFWQNFSTIIEKLTPINKALLATRDDLQTKIDSWHQNNFADNFDFSSYKKFLKDINYLVPEVEDFAITTENVDAELATMAGPQLVVPIMNARFAINAVNARWGSLYDALYGSDVISAENGAENAGGYNAVRGQKVIEFARQFLDQSIPLTAGSHAQAKHYNVSDAFLTVTLESGETVKLENGDAFKGYQGTVDAPTALLFEHNGLHFEINFDESSVIAKSDKAGISDITLESALTTIMDCEDSVAAVDADDKVVAYKNWLGLMQGNLTTDLVKNGKTIQRTMAVDRQYHQTDGANLTLKGRSLMFVRNVGHLMTNNAILLADGSEVPEGIIDAMVTSLIASLNLQQTAAAESFCNSAEKSIYIVKPKMHGPEEVAFANTLFEQVEDALALTRNTIKMGIMDEERRTSVNLKACIAQAKSRVVFINTGFLDRTGDEIHTSMAAGIMAKKADIKLTPWISAYEDNNVDVGLACGFSGRAQIGKGMWPIPDQMLNMLATKINHVQAGANTAWVPSPTAATLHALHYHRENVFALQKKLMLRTPANLDDILTIPLAKDTNWSEQEISDELDNNAQGILGYVVRWIDQGVGCSKVPDINNVGLMEDRATLRISSQHMANWMKHEVCSEQQVLASLKKMAKTVDSQNKNDANYQPMASNFEKSIAFKAACDLVFLGTTQVNGYTEPLLHSYRLKVKQLS
ncbi:malate synthase G [Colwellia sp. PAMC 20917]|uniref:malate synthase G n=1 Tax=Colwellia sp. PAMC 20917 TaxID=1816218 RepID=UPI000878F49A|nr:malate synthase G [Colwellia sp. PAMC 20917]AOW77795.1 malate synthase G [Colwellia sp. PAMC 20917]